MINTVITALEEYGEYMKITKRFSVETLMRKLEPIHIENYEKRKNEVPRILVIHGGGVGDFVLFSATLREIRRIYEGAYITLLVCTSALDLAETCPYVNAVINCDFLHDIYTDNPICYDKCAEFIRRNFTETFDISFNYSCCFSGCLLAYMSGARTRFLYIDSWYWELFNLQIAYGYAEALSTELPPRQTYSPHVVDLYLSVLDNMLHTFVTNREIEVWHAPEDEMVIESISAKISKQGRYKYIALCMGGLGGFKSYPPEKYAKLLQLILEDDENIRVVIIGGSAEKEAGAFVTSQLPYDRVYNLTGKITFRQTAALLAKCDYYIGNDTSCMHIAAAVKLPVLTVFSYPVDREREECSVVDRYYPYHVPAAAIQPQKTLPECRQAGSKVHKIFGCFSNKPHCITQIEVEEMYKGWKKLSALYRNNLNELSQ